MSAIQSTSRPAAATRSLAGVSVPDTSLIARAIEYARENSQPYPLIRVDMDSITIS